MRTARVHAHLRTAHYSDASMKREAYLRALARGANKEAKEHPWLTLTQAAKVASDHLKEDPAYYDRENH